MKLTNAVKRKIVQLAAFGFSNSHVSNFCGGKLYTGSWKKFCNPGLNCYSCPAASAACPIGALQAVSGSMDFKFSFYAVGFLLAVGVLLGRFICGWLCPFGLIQELIHKIPSPKWKIWRGFRYVKYVILVVFVLLMPVMVTNFMGMGKPAFCQYICPSGTLLGGLPMLGTHPELRETIGSLFSLKLAILIGTLLGCVFVFRFFCKVLCPLGAIYGLLNKISVYHLEVDEKACVNCGKCVNTCMMDVNPVKAPNSAECIRCGKCVQECPVQAIHMGFTSRKGEHSFSQQFD